MFFRNRKVMSLFFLYICIWSGSAFAQPVAHPGPLPEAALENQRGTGFYNRGFYEMIPHGQKSDAMKEFVQAEKAFKKAIELDGSYIDAHRNLARLYFVRENYSEAAAEYEQLLSLEPDNIDNYAFLALALTSLGNIDGAIECLELAKTRTTDKQILQKLDQYITKAKEAE